MDKRKQIFLDRLNVLSVEQVIRIKDNIDRICFDTYNYDVNTNTYCPIAIGLGLDKSILYPTDEKVRDEIGKFFNPPNALKGVEGEFYTTNRKDDLLAVCNEVIKSRLKGWTIPVLDTTGYVRLIDWMGNDERIVEAARISYKSPSKGPEQDRKLLHYLWKNKHTSPFEMVKVTLNIKLPIFVMRQYVRHRMQNLNEVSARYTELPDDFYIPRTWRRQDTKNKQGSLSEETINPFISYHNDVHCATEMVIRHCQSSYKLYKELLDKGISREMARMVLPINIYTEIYACWDMKNLTHFITLREDSHAQAEIQEYAKAIKTIVKELFPNTIEAFDKYKFKLVEQ